MEFRKDRYRFGEFVNWRDRMTKIIVTQDLNLRDGVKVTDIDCWRWVCGLSASVGRIFMIL
jgi:hypothetical protein